MGDREERFRPVDGLPGKLYVPRASGLRKHPCKDCFSCQWCGDARCTACRGSCEGPQEAEHHPDQKGNG